ncbi:transcription factor with AP2 domain, putative [Babesia caballi]|uniref:Transcription factor with AP2 domain, putative n=1 Tax=Babesia caballi TaxID=5871 RepID=A0AAV4LP89_BABCB|nr:transcription factor with AP2 domain, putative [Babesia caballi]
MIPSFIVAPLIALSRRLPRGGQLRPYTSGFACGFARSAVAVHTGASAGLGAPFPKRVPWAAVQLRPFAGRQRGLKRRKNKKEPRRIQQAVGRRLELFYPKGARKTRVRLVQNARGNVVFDPVLRRFLVVYYKQGVQVFRQFRAHGSRFEIARSRAIAFARQMAEEHLRRYNARPGAANGQAVAPVGSNIINLESKLQPDCNLSGVRGVFFDAKSGAWAAVYKDAGLRKYRLFPTRELGFQSSYAQAVEFLRFALYRNHQFLHRRTRTRKNRPVLKP